MTRCIERVQASGAEVVQEPTEQPYGVLDCAVRDPAGNLLRINDASPGTRSLIRFDAPD